MTECYCSICNGNSTRSLYLTNKGAPAPIAKNVIRHGKYHALPHSHSLYLIHSRYTRLSKLYAQTRSGNGSPHLSRWSGTHVSLHWLLRLVLAALAFLLTQASLLAIQFHLLMQRLIVRVDCLETGGHWMRCAYSGGWSLR